MRPLRAAVGSAVFVVVVPSVVGGALPWLLTGWQATPEVPLEGVRGVVGGLLVLAGSVVLLGAVVRFAREGRGTPAPIGPTERLVVSGAYRYVRNPMYLAVGAVILGQAIVLWSGLLLGYAAVYAAAVAAFVRWYEEPTLLRTHGDAYAAYLREVPRWMPRGSPWQG